MNNKKRLFELMEKVSGLPLNDDKILTDLYFIKRVPPFKLFENNSGGEEVRFNYFKNWHGENAAILHFGKGNGFIKFPYLSIETKFAYFTQRTRDFKSEEALPIFKPMFTTIHNFVYSTDVHMNLPKDDDLENVKDHIVSLMVKEIIKNNFKFTESFKVKDTESLPMDKIDTIFNKINENLYYIEESLGKMNLAYF